MLRKRKRQEVTTTTTDTIARGSAQWWYNHMSKQYHMRLDARLKYNPATARIELKLTYRNVYMCYAM